MLKLTLTLLEAGVLLVDDVQLAVAADNLAIHAALLNGGFDFHGNKGLKSLESWELGFWSVETNGTLPSS
jgi:hypothetical protein